MITALVSAYVCGMAWGDTNCHSRAQEGPGWRGHGTLVTKQLVVGIVLGCSAATTTQRSVRMRMMAGGEGEGEKEGSDIHPKNETTVPASKHQ